MGLDLVELAIEVEKSFGITIVNEDASNIITVGQLYDYVLAKLPAQETRRCLSAGAFYEFRRALIAQFAVKPGEIRPSTLIGSIIPEPKRTSDWELLARRLDWRLPPLVRPAWMSTALLGILLGWVAATIAVWGRTTGFSLRAFPLAVACILFGSISLSVVALQFTTPFATRFSQECLTVRGAVQAALALNYGKLSTQGPGWNREEVWECLRTIIVEQLGVAPEQVVESAEFVKDFGAD
jgi:acyl carrier protein